MGGLRVSLFGAIRVVPEYGAPEVKAPPKAQALLAYLLIHGPRLHPREVLIDVFWQNQDEARNCLSSTLWRLKRVLEPAGVAAGTYLITRSDGEVGFNWDSDHWLDLEIFEQQANRLLSQTIPALRLADVECFEEALRLYTGDLLHGFYEDWAIEAQERLRCLYLDALEHLMRYYQHHGRPEKSLAYGQQLLVREPLQEEIHREMMRIYLENGQRPLAIRQYQACREILARELGLSPMPETEALYLRAFGTNGRNEPVATVPIPAPAIKQLLLAAQGFEEAQQQWQMAQQGFERAVQHLHQALQWMDHPTGR